MIPTAPIQDAIGLLALAAKHAKVGRENEVTANAFAREGYSSSSSLSMEARLLAIAARSLGRSHERLSEAIELLTDTKYLMKEHQDLLHGLAQVLPGSKLTFTPFADEDYLCWAGAGPDAQVARCDDGPWSAEIVADDDGMAVQIVLGVGDPQQWIFFHGDPTFKLSRVDITFKRLADLGFVLASEPESCVDKGSVAERLLERARRRIEETA